METNVSASCQFLMIGPCPISLRTRQCELGASCKELGCLNRLEDQTLAHKHPPFVHGVLETKKGRFNNLRNEKQVWLFSFLSKMGNFET